MSHVSEFVCFGAHKSKQKNCSPYCPPFQKQPFIPQTISLLLFAPVCMILFPIHHIFVYISFNLWTFAFFFPHTFGFQWPRLLHRFDCVVCNLQILYYRRGSSQDIRDRSPDHGTMGRKQRFVWLYFCYCMTFYSYSLLRNDDSTSWKDFYDNFTVVCVSFSYSKRIQGLNHRCTSAVKSKFIACPSCWSHFLDNHLYGYIYILLYLCILLLEIINKKKSLHVYNIFDLRNAFIWEKQFCSNSQTASKDLVIRVSMHVEQGSLICPNVLFDTLFIFLSPPHSNFRNTKISKKKMAQVNL